MEHYTMYIWIFTILSEKNYIFSGFGAVYTVLEDPVGAIDNNFVALSV